MLLELANLLMDTGESRPALACLKWLIAIKPDQVSGWLNLSVAQILAQDITVRGSPAASRLCKKTRIT